MANYTHFVFYQDTPFTDFQNTLNFGSNFERDYFFKTHYKQFERNVPFNFIRDRLTVTVSSSDGNFKDMSSVNYCKFTSDFDNIDYYCQVVNMVYENRNAFKLYLVIDGLMTFCQGDISNYTKNVQVERQHLPKQVHDNNLLYLTTNDDVLNFNTLRYVHEDRYTFTKLKCIFRSSADLSKKFGNENSPHLTTAKGQIFDGIVSPQNLYECDYDKFNDLMEILSNYPWIAQNITSVLLVPEIMINSDNLEPVKMQTGKFNDLYKFKNATYSKDFGEISELSKDMNTIKQMFKVDDDDLLRDSYCNIKLTNYAGQELPISIPFLPQKGLSIYGLLICGYDNEMIFYPDAYQDNNDNILSEDSNIQAPATTGSFLDHSIIFKDFDTAPLLIDNAKQSIASDANRRNLAIQNQPTNLVKNAVAPNTSPIDRLGSAVSVLSDISASALKGRMVDEWQFYRKMHADIKDKKLQAPSVTAMSTSNFMAMKQNYFGVYLKYSRIGRRELNLVKKYHANFGYEWNRTDDLQPVNSMKYCNYVKFTGNWVIDDRNVPQSIMEQIRAQFENGVRMWHNPDKLAYPFRQDITDLNTYKGEI